MKISKLIYITVFLGMLIQFSFGQGIRVKPGTNITINNSTTLKMIDGDNLTILDNQTYSPSLLEKGNLIFSGGGELEVQQYLEKYEWHIVSAPVNGETINTYMNMFLYSYDEPTNVFTNLYSPLTTPLNIGEGYHVWSVPPAVDIITFNGTSITSDINRNLTVTDATDNSGWNLLGNPFPCVLDWNGDADWLLNNVGSTVYLFDAAAGNYKTWNFNLGGIGTNGKTNGYIASTQGFWVRTNDTIGSQPSYSLTLPASQRVASPTTEFYKNSPILTDMLRLQVRSEEYSDELIVGYNPASTKGFDNDLDAYKLFMDTKSLKLFSVTSEIKQAVNFLPSIEGNEVIPVSFMAAKDGSFKIAAKGIESFSSDLPIYLEDKLEDIYINLRINPEYSFNATTSDISERFNIHFAAPIGINEQDISPMESIQIYSWEKSVYVNIPFEISGYIEVYDLLGKLLIQDRALEGNNIISLKNVTGNYIVRIIGSKGLKTKKINIR